MSETTYRRRHPRWHQAWQRPFWLAGAIGLAAAALAGGAGPARAAGTYPSNAPLVGLAATPDGGGYWQVASDGGIFAFGDAGFFGSMGGKPLNAGVVGIAATPDGKGYWEVAADGGIFAFGDAGFFGSMGGKPLNAGVVGIAATPDGKGYWEVAADGGIFAFGDAGFFGSMGGKALNAPVAGVAATPDGKGYWEVAADGGIFAFGDAGFYGSMGGKPLNDPVTAMAATPDGRGYWLAGSDGGVFAFGDAKFYGSMGGSRLAGSVNSIARASGGGGYWLGGVDGGIFAFGSASYDGRAAYTPPTPAASTIGQRAANLAISWQGRGYTGISTDYWHAPASKNVAYYWCAYFATYVWQHAGVPVPTESYVPTFQSWAQQNGRFSAAVASLHVGDVIFYSPNHVGVVVQVSPNGSVSTEDGDWDGTSGHGETAFAQSSKVMLNTFNTRNGEGAGHYTISGIGLIG